MRNRISPIKTIEGTQYIGKLGTVPVYDIHTLNGLNQIIGYMKHSYANQGTVLYRGQCDLYDRIIPSILHAPESEDNYAKLLDEVKEKMFTNEKVTDFFGWKDNDISGWELYIKMVYEAILQHYGAPTYSVDFVDNHWAALWFSVFRYDPSKQTYSRRDNDDKNITVGKIQYDPYFPKTNEFIKQKQFEDLFTKKASDLQVDSESKRLVEDILNRFYSVRIEDIDNKTKENVERIQKMYDQFMERQGIPSAYLFLMLAHTQCPEIQGLYIGEETYTIDLRKAVPDKFLRPVAQHGWIIKGRERNYDFNKDLICVLRMTVKQVNDYLGTGQLLTQENFFPRPTADKGYELLLQKYAACGLVPNYYVSSDS